MAVRCGLSSVRLCLGVDGREPCPGTRTRSPRGGPRRSRPPGHSSPPRCGLRVRGRTRCRPGVPPTLPMRRPPPLAGQPEEQREKRKKRKAPRAETSARKGRAADSPPRALGPSALGGLPAFPSPPGHVRAPPSASRP